jgi:hypothetical protein
VLGDCRCAKSRRRWRPTQDMAEFHVVSREVMHDALGRRRGSRDSDEARNRTRRIARKVCFDWGR